MNLVRSLGLLLFALGLSACSTLSEREPASAQSFHAQGLVGITSPEGAESGNFNWQQQGMDYRIEFYGPLGLGATYLEGNSTGVVLTLSNQQQYQAASPEALLQKVLNWSLPVSGLRYWLLARPIPNVPFTIIQNYQGQVLKLQQEGWNIHYEWQDQQNFAHKIVLTQQHLKVVIIINALSS